MLPLVPYEINPTSSQQQLVNFSIKMVDKEDFQHYRRLYNITIISSCKEIELLKFKLRQYTVGSR